MKRAFIRALWGSNDVSQDEGWITPSKRYERMDLDIKLVLSEEYQHPFRVYVFGKENYEYIKSKGIEDCVMVNEEPVVWDLQKEFWRHKLDILRYAMEEDGYDEIVYLDWDCILVKEMPDDFWKILGKKEKIQANLQFYKRRKCLWRKGDHRKTSNGGFLYIRDRNVPSELIEVWEGFDEQTKFWDEISISKYIDNCMGGWKGIDEYWKLYEPEVCNLAIVNNKNRSAFSEDILSGKGACFEHFIQAMGTRKARLKNYMEDDEEN